MTLYTLTGWAGDLIFEPFDTRRTKVWIETNIDNDVIIDYASANTLRLGNARATIDDTGHFEFADLVPTNGVVNPTGFQYKVYIDYPKSIGGRATWDSGWFSFTEDADLADLVAEQYAPPQWQTEFMEDAQELLDAQIDLSGIDDSDTAVAGLVTNGVLGPLTQAALDKKYARVFTPEAYGAVGNGTTDDSTALQACIDAAEGQGYVQLGAKTYKFLTPLVIDHEECSIRGRSREGSILKFAGTGVAVASADVAILRHWRFSDFTIDTRSASAGAVGLQLANVYASHFTNLRLRCTTSVGGKALVLKGGDAVTGRSTYFNHFDDLRASADGVVVEFTGYANAQRFVGGLLEGAGIAVKGEDGITGTNLGGSNFTGTAFQTSNATMIQLGKAAGSVANVTNFQFIGCRYEADTPVSIVLHPNCVAAAFIGGALSADVTFTDNSAGAGATIIQPGTKFRIGGAGKTALELPYSTAGITWGGDAACTIYRRTTSVLKTDGDFDLGANLRVNQGGASGTTITGSTIAADGTDTNVTLNLNAKGSNRLQLNVGGSATGGTQIEKTTGKIGFFGQTTAARPAAYTQTYATATRTHSNPTAAAVATTAAALTSYGYTQAQADAIPVAINALVTDLANTKQVLNQLLDDLQTLGLLQ